MDPAADKSRKDIELIGMFSSSRSIRQPDTQRNTLPQEAQIGHFISWQVENKSAKPQEKFPGDQVDPGLLFINQIGAKGPKSRDRKGMRSHVMRRYVHQRNEIEEQTDRKKHHVESPLLPNVDRLLGAGDLDPFHSLPVKISSSSNRLLHYFVKHIAPLHYPHGRGGERDPITIRWMASAVTDAALLHSTLGSSSGHMLYYANLPSLSPGFLSSFLYHKTETIRLINERMKDTSKVLTDETLGAIALLVSGQTCQGDYNEMQIHMRGLMQLVNMRGGLETLGMGGLLAGEILWCDNVTAFLSSFKTFLAMPRISNDPFEEFEDPNLNLFLTSVTTGEDDDNSPLSKSVLKQILPDGLIAALYTLQKMTALLNTSPTLSEHDMLVYDRRRASIQHQLANLDNTDPIGDSHSSIKSCHLATIIYSILTLWGFTPPMNLYRDLAKPLQSALQAIDRIDHQGIWRDIMLWTLFIGGYAASGRQEQASFLHMIREALQERSLVDWHSVRNAFDGMPIYHTLWNPFEVIYRKAVISAWEAGPQVARVQEHSSQENP